MNEKILLIINASLGELHVALPVLKHIKDSYSKIGIYSVCISRQVEEQVKGDNIYFDILNDVSTIIERRDMPKFLYKEAFSIRLILKEQGAVSKASIIARIKRVCRNAKLVLYPHAFALYDYKLESEKRDDIAGSYDEDVVDHLLTTSTYDYNYFSQRISKEKVHIIGALGYTDWWREHLINYSKAIGEVKDIQGKTYKKKILLTLRGPHKIYLPGEYFDQLMKTVLEELFKLPDCLLVIKPHPRQDVELVKSYLNNFPKDRWVISNMNTFTLATLSDFTVSFWSSAITDSLAMGIPAIEYYKYETNFYQTLVDEDDRIVSFYTKLNFALRANTKEELSSAIKLVLSDYSFIKSKQLQAFNDVFCDRLDSRERVDNFLQKQIFANNNINKKRMSVSMIYDFVRITFWSQKNK